MVDGSLSYPDLVQQGAGMVAPASCLGGSLPTSVPESLAAER